jgi:hypothetical protein
MAHTLMAFNVMHALSLAALALVLRAPAQHALLVNSFTATHAARHALTVLT